MRNTFAAGNGRNSILFSKGLDLPLIFEIPIPQPAPRWLYPKIYPVPASSFLMTDVSYDIRWIGRVLAITNIQGQSVQQLQINSSIQEHDVSRLTPGIYFLTGKSLQGETIKIKFVKL